MATNYRRRVLDGLIDVLADATNGFNAKLAAVAEDYGITPYEIGWRLPSDNCVYGQMDELGARVSQLITFPGAIVYTTSALKENKVKFCQFSGLVVAQIDFIIRLRLIDDPDNGANIPDGSGDYEKHADAVEDAMLAALTAGSALFAAQATNWTQYKTVRSSVVETGDGHIQRVTFTLGFEVHI